MSILNLCHRLYLRWSFWDSIESKSIFIYQSRPWTVHVSICVGELRQHWFYYVVRIIKACLLGELHLDLCFPILPRRFYIFLPWPFLLFIHHLTRWMADSHTRGYREWLLCSTDHIFHHNYYSKLPVLYNMGFQTFSSSAPQVQIDPMYQNQLLLF